MATVVVIGVLLGSTSCGDVNAVFEKVADARQLTADLQVEFTNASDAANRAVMADTDERSGASAREAEQGFAAIQAHSDQLGRLLKELEFADETTLLLTFLAKFTEYRALEHNILALAAEDSNIKASQLSFGGAAEAVDTFRDAIQSITPAVPRDAWRVKALGAAALASVREVQALQAPHIADARDDAMTAFEKRMAAAESSARTGLAELRTLAAPASNAHLNAATEALDRFAKIHAEVIVLSRKNTNVRSLALALEEKRLLVAPCQETLRALRQALEARRAGRG